MATGMESNWFHPLVRAWLEKHGYQTEHEVTMPLFGRADFVARKGKTTLIVECKVIVDSLPATLRQVRDYCQQFGQNARPVIACPQDALSSDQLQVCETAKVKVFRLPVLGKDKREKRYVSMPINPDWLSFVDECRVCPEKVIGELLAYHENHNTSPIDDLFEAWTIALGNSIFSEQIDKSYRSVLDSLPNQDDVEAYSEAWAVISKFRQGPSYISARRLASYGFDYESEFEALRRKRLSYLLFQAIQFYFANGKDDHWIQMRFDESLKYLDLRDLLHQRISETFTDQDYSTIMEDIYFGVWQRTSAQLRNQLELPKNVSLRDNQPTLALTYQGLAEEVSAQRLGDKTELTWEEARKIVRAVAMLIGVQAKATSAFLGVDIATGKPLLSESK